MVGDELPGFRLNGLRRLAQFVSVLGQVRAAAPALRRVQPVLDLAGGALVEDVLKACPALFALAGLRRALVPATGAGRQADHAAELGGGVFLLLALGLGDRRRGGQFAKRARHLVGAGKAVVRILPERVLDDVVPPHVQLAVRLRGHLEYAERQVPGDQFVKTDAEAVDVGALVNVLGAGELLRRHVLERAHGMMVARDLQPALRLGQVRQAEVGDLHLLLAVDHDVARLDVAVHHAVPVRVGQSGEDLFADLQHLVRREFSLPAQAILQRLALDVLHHDEIGLAFAAAVNHADDVRVIQVGEDRRFPLEPLDEELVLGEIFRKDFDGDGAVEGQLPAAENDGHAAGTQERLDDIVADLLARLEAQREILGRLGQIPHHPFGDSGLAMRTDEVCQVRVGLDAELMSAAWTGDVLLGLRHWDSTYPVCQLQEP